MDPCGTRHTEIKVAELDSGPINLKRSTHSDPPAQSVEWERGSTSKTMKLIK